MRRLVELHGGGVEAWSAGRGQGAEFAVRLPLRQDEEADAALHAAAAGGERA